MESCDRSGFLALIDKFVSKFQLDSESNLYHSTLS